MDLAIIFLLLSMIPAIEARGATVYFVCSNQVIFIPAVIVLNFIGVLFFLFIIDRVSIPKKINMWLKRNLNKKKQKADSWFAKYGNLFIFLLVGLPSTGIGSYSGALLGRIFGLRGKVFYLTLIGGIIISLLPAVVLGLGINLLGFTCPIG
jgi:uncharacterized membrane protein